MLRRSFLCAALASAAAFIAGCDNSSSSTASTQASNAGGGGGAGGGRKTVMIGFIGKSQSNAVFKVAERGAQDAAHDLADKYNVNINVVVRTPAEEDATKQSEAIDSLVNDGANAIILSASEAATLRNAIDRAVEKGIPVMTFDSDVPDSKRFACYATNDRDSGFKLVDALAKSMNNTGTVAVLAGNQSAPNLQARVAGVKEALKKYPNMKLAEPNGVFYHQETPEKAAQAVSDAMQANKDIKGWAMIGGWPLFTNNALQWPAGSVKVTAIDALPQQLQYIRDGHVDVLFAQDCYGWGHKGVETVLEKLVNNKSPESPNMAAPLTPITKENVDAWAENWKKWLPS